MTTRDAYMPQTSVERELLADCERIGAEHLIATVVVLHDAVRWWKTAGRSIHPRLWRSRVAAAERLIARGRLIAECATMGVDPSVEISGFAKMTAVQLADQLVYLGDHQG